MKTWTHEETGKLWLQDFLPSALPGARIYTYGYDSKIPSVTESTIRDYGVMLMNAILSIRTEENEVCMTSSVL